DYLRSVGLNSSDIVARISSRSMLAEILLAMGFASEEHNKIYSLLDKMPKVSPQAFAEMVAEQITDAHLREEFMKLPALKTLADVDAVATSDGAKTALSELRELYAILESMGVADYCKFDIQIVRGLAYYTGPVFEIFDRSESLRAICGGGRYDSLLTILGGPKVPATGFGMGDVVLEILLREKGLLPELTSTIDYFVIDAGAELFDRTLKLVCDIRQRGRSASFSYKRQNLGKNFKLADNQKARYAIVVGQETIDRNEITIKELASGEQRVMAIAEFLGSL
ncbi:MAG: ATP phosphoribosyltransferase regulatory subunit, partial [Sedimentisphaerales bacterium]|nr:ATP phosphoribosyltransferase regulatory subunit [Sedimentisphaerales bacterium]